MSLTILDETVARNIERAVIKELITNLEYMFRYMEDSDVDRTIDIRHICDTITSLAHQHVKREKLAKTAPQEVNF